MDSNYINKGFKLATLLVVGILVLILGQLVYNQQVINQQNQNQITVSGEGKIYAKPDIALISLGVTTTAKTVADVTKNNTNKMNSVIDEIKKLGVDEKDIQTTNYNLSPVYENYSIPSNISTGIEMMYPIRTGSTITGYRLDQNVQVKIRDFSKISDILSQTTAKGANAVGDLQFTIDDPEQFRQQARAKAIAQAKANAQNLAKSAGISLGKIINVYDGYSPVMYSTSKLGMGGAATDSAVPAPTIQPGQQEINVTVNLTYKVR